MTKTKAIKKSNKKSKSKKFQSKITIDGPSQKKIIISCIIGILIAIFTISVNTCSFDTDKPNCFCGIATAPITSKTKLRDINSVQLEHARANGLKRPIPNKKVFENILDSLIENDKIKKIKPCRYYNIRPLTHSFPYLTPEAANLLKLIGKRFHENLKEVGLPIYKYQISSLLRTIEFQRQLTRINENASPSESAHYYGTTFDIAYDKYDRRGKSISDPKIEAILEKTLKELRSECKLLIIRERSNKCFHITVVKPKI